MKKILLIALVLLSFSVVGCKKEEKVYSVTYTLDGGKLSKGAVLTLKKSSLPVALIAPTKEGHTFLGWYETSTFAGEVISNLTEEKDYILYAKWEIDEVPSFTLTYILGGGVNSTANKGEFTSENLPITLAPPTREYFNFLGWYDTGDFSGSAITKVSELANITLYAKWDQGENRVVYNMDGGAWPYTYPFESREAMVSEFITDFNICFAKAANAQAFFASGTYGVNVASMFTNEAYSAKWGWMKTYIIGIAQKQSYSGLGLLNLGDSSLWRANIHAFLNSIKFPDYPYSADFSNDIAANGFWNDIKISPEITTTYTVIAEDVVLINPIKKGYNFVGWYDDSDAKVTVIKSGSQGCIQLLAKWEERIYPSEIVINKPIKANVDKDITWDLDISILPLNAEDIDLIMSSSNEAIATITDGIIKTYAYGEVTFTIASVYNPAAVKSFTITVFPNPEENMPVVYATYDTFPNIVIKKGQSFNEFSGVHAYDEIDGNITADIVLLNNTFSNNVVGKYTLTYEVTNSLSNKATLERTVLVNEFTWVGHRGSSGAHVSNTMAAFEEGVSRGYKALECDIRVTKDNQFVIFHNEYLNGDSGEKVLSETKNVTTPESKTLAELQAMTVTQTRSTTYPPAGTYTGKIATLGEYLDLCKLHDITPIIEIKWTTGLNSNDTSKVSLLVDFVKSKGWYEKSVFMTSMRPVLEAIRAANSDANLQWLCGSTATLDAYKNWAITNRISLDIEYSALNANIVKEFHNNGLLVNSYTLNAITSASLQINYDIDMITTDYLYHSGSMILKKFA